MDWNKEAAYVIKAVKSRYGVEWKDIVKLLKDDLDFELSSRAIANRVSNGAFSFVLALQILAVLKVKEIDIPEVK